MRIGFTREILIPNFVLYPEFMNNDLMRNCSYGSNCDSTRLLASRELSSQQEQAVELVNKGIVKLNKLEYPLVDI